MTNVALVEAAAALRELAAALVDHEADEETLAAVADAARTLADRVSTGPRLDRAARMSALATTETTPEVAALPERPVGGLTNPTAVPMVVHRAGDRGVVAEVVIDPLFQGGEGRAHGGIVAGLFDDITGHVVTMLGVPAVTGRLSVAYRAPTPTDVPVVFRAWVMQKGDRRILIEAEARHGDTVTATAEAVFVVVDDQRFVRHIPQAR
jgi:acyl-coenzyme A thioesterase PaaI-like protein